MTVDRSNTIPTNYTICTSATRPAAPLVGRMIYEADTRTFFIYDGSAWQTISIADEIMVWI